MKLGIVAIGRNEGERLTQCLQSAKNFPIVYVDSGSTDNSVENATALGAECVSLDMSIPFTAARARNAGFESLLSHYPDLDYVQFVDGDCELDAQWLATSLDHFTNQEVAAICGRRREKQPQASFYNLMCDIEWDTPIGETNACGGDAIYRVDVFKKVQGFDPSFIAGEEPELCFRIRQLGLKILRIDAEMTLHDADMHKFSQFWQRFKRAGYAYTVGAIKHGKASDERYYVNDVKRIIRWLIIYVTAAVTSLVFLSVIPLLLLSAFMLLQAIRITSANKRQLATYGRAVMFKYSLFLLIGKIPAAMGAIKCFSDHRAGRNAKIIEYK